MLLRDNKAENYLHFVTNMGVKLRAVPPSAQGKSM